MYVRVQCCMCWACGNLDGIDLEFDDWNGLGSGISVEPRLA